MNRRQTVLGWLLVVAGFTCIGAGWGGVQSTTVVAVQMAYLTSGGFVGLGLVILGASIQRNDDLRVIREAVEELRERFDDLGYDLSDTRAALRDLEHQRLKPLDSEAPARRQTSS